MSNQLKTLQLVVLIGNESLKKSDAIVCLEGDGYARIKESADLYKKRWAPFVVISGGSNRPEAGCYPATILKTMLEKEGISSDRIILENKSQHTRDQAVEVMKLVKEKGWRKILLVGSHFHQLRAFLTFLKAMQEANLKIQIINAPVRDLPWFKPSPFGPTRIELFTAELIKMEQYSKDGHIANIDKAIEYQEWKEKQK